VQLLVAQQALPAGFGQCVLAPVRVFGGHDPLDRLQPVIEAPCGVVKLVE
jgi:hypothetical protein